MARLQPNPLAAIRGTRLVLVVLMGLLVLVGLARAATGAYVEILWQLETGYASAFWTRVFWQWGLRILGGAAVGVLVFVNLKIASTTLGGIQIRRRFGNLEISEQIPRQYVTAAMLAAAVLLGLWFGAALPASLGRRALLLANAEPWGLIDPVLGHDVGFYVFWLPLLMPGSIFALTATFLIFTLATAGYAATGALSWSQGRVVAHPLARTHLGMILGVFFFLLALRLWLGRYWLLIEGGSDFQGIFGYTDAQARLPALQTLAMISLGAMAASIWGAWKNRPAPVVGAFAAVVLGTILIGEFYPSLVQNFRVEPNELERESVYIEHNMEFTRLGFGLDSRNLERRPYAYSPDEPVDWADVSDQMAGLPVWSRSALLTTYKELEALFPYYDFLDVTIDRYPGPDGPVPVALSVRQVDPAGIQDQNWQNLHLRERYVAGMGAVASRAAARTPEGRPEMLLGETRPESAGSTGLALELTRPEIFFGTGVQEVYAVVSPGPDQYLAPDGAPGVPGVDYPRGIPLRSKVRTALLAWWARDARLLFASELTDDSRFIFRRRVAERVAEIAPFLRFPDAPYPVISDGRVVWIVEGFTGSGYFPLATVAGFDTFRTQDLRYLRNSIKATVDAVSGEVNFYRVPIEDPLADVYARAFPDLFKPISDMPAELRAHVRYSRQMLDVQVRVLLQYHQETAPAFHGQQDVWNEPQELAENTSPVPYRPEYGLYRLPGEEEARYQLTTVFVPAGRQNLTAVLVARTGPHGVPELILFDVPVEQGVPGPRQIEALVEQDPEISQQFSLWRTGGSQVWTGHLHLVPAGDRFFYMEPVFLAAEADAIPELRRFVLSDGVSVAMTETLPDAIAQLSGGAVIGGPPPRERGDGVPSTMPMEEWPAAALELLEEAESRAREGDWQGFGEALARLRSLLEGLRSGTG